MDTQLELLIRMKDQLSKPLTDQQKALKAVTAQISALKKEEAAAAKEQAKFAKEAAALGETIEASMAAAAAAAVVSIMALGAALAYATIELVKFSAAQSSIGEKASAGYLLFTKDAEQATKTRDMIEQMATRLRMAPEQLHGTAKDLLTSGIKNQAELQNSVRAVASLQKVGGDAQAQKLKGIFEKNAETRRQFGGRGQFAITRNEAEATLGSGGFEALQKSILKYGGQARGNLQGMYAQLYTSADVGNKALADVINNGKIGDAAKKMVGGFPELIQHAQTVVYGFFKDLAKSEGFQAFMKNLHMAIDVLEVIGSGGGKKQATGILNAGFALLAKGVRQAIIWLLIIRIKVLDFATAAVKAYIALKQWFSQGDRLNILKAALIGVGLLLALILTTVVLLAIAFAALWLVIMAPLLIIVAAFALLGVAIYEVTKHFKKWKMEALEAASNLVDGLVTGMRNGVKAVQAASGQLGDAALDGVKHALAIQSPSREMMKLGALSAQGFQGGLDSAGGFTMGGIQPKLSVGGGAQSGSGNTYNFDIVVNGTGMTQDDLKPLMTDAFADALERVQLEYGAGAT